MVSHGIMGSRIRDFSFPWDKVKPLFLQKMDQVMKEFQEQVPMEDMQSCPNVENVEFDDMRKQLLEAVEGFTGCVQHGWWVFDVNLY